MTRETWLRDGKVYEGKDGRRLGAIVVKPSDVRLWARSSSARISERYVVASGDHESGLSANEVDYEAPDEQGHVFVSKGLYQVSDKEATDVGHPGANLLDPVIATIVFARLAEHNLDYIIAHLPPALATVFALHPDRWAYLALGHNEGLGRFAATTANGRASGALTTIFNHGINWTAYEQRNAGRGICQYGRDCITGGPHFNSP